VSLIRKFEPNYLVLSAGMDIYADDPLGKIKVTTEGIGEIANRLFALDLPTVIIMEGGYANEVLGKNIVKFLGEFNEISKNKLTTA
jgi:acetoin utilization deacetylase AcuC-like enzyme